ncbi:MAG: phosphate-selective porin OprO and OprP, partial [Gemmatimonadales bacterium]|nr:phosphate-selective porin OprO and OprP [Gemmatimonadales bacterium]
MRNFRSWRAVVGLVVAAIASGWRRASAQQDTTARDSQSLEARLDQLDQELRILKRLRELALDSAANAPKDKPGAGAGKDGFSLKTADGKFALRLRGLIQTDARFFVSDSGNTAVDNFFVRRARVILEGTLWKYLEFRLQPDFGQGQTVLFDAYSDIKLGPALAIRVGKFKPPIGLERLQSASDIVFAERALATNLVPNRDIGLQLSGEVASGVVSYQAGVFNGVPDLGNGDADVHDAKDFAGRLFLQPFRRGRLQGLGFGVAGSTGIERGTTLAPALPSYRTPGQQVFFRYRSDGTAPNTTLADGNRRRLVPQAYFYTGPLGLIGEYAFSWQEVRRTTTTATLEHTSWQITGSFFVTGEKASFKSAAPKHPFDPGSHAVGALEFAARYSRLSVDDAAFPLYANPAVSAPKAKAWAVGANWYLARAIKVVVDYERTTFAGGAAVGNRRAENL